MTEQLKPSLYETRIAVCRACDSHRDLAPGVLQCKECGCIMTMKARFPGVKCPLGYW